MFKKRSTLGLLSVLFLMAAMLGCSKGDFATAKTIGIVKCKGQPVANAAVYFEPMEAAGSKNAKVGKQGFAFTDAEGKFVISTYVPAGGDGAVVGKHRVRVGRGDAKCDCSMNDEVDLMQVEVKSGQTNEFVIELKEATAASKRQEAMLSDDEDE
jgi:hypothetical protein